MGTRKRNPSLALRAGRRPALTLLEVLVALSIFLLAMVVFGDMIVRNGDIARDIQHQNTASRLCQSKLAEVVAGAVPLTSEGDTPFDEEPQYTWSVQADNGAVDGLWNVTVVVTWRPTDVGQQIQCSLSQLVLDPSLVGNTQDVVPVTSSTTAASTSASSTSAGGAATGTSGTSGASKTSTTSPSSGATSKPSSGGK